MSKVATSSNRDTLARETEGKIYKLLLNNEVGCTPKELSFLLNKNPNTTKSMCVRMKRKGILEINPKSRGVYRLVDKYRQGAFFDWFFHNLILTFKLPSYEGEREVEKFSNGLINFNFEIGGMSKQATLRISCSQSPINLSSIYLCYISFVFLIQKYSKFSPEIKDVSIETIEFNKDYFNLRLDGAKCVTLENLFHLFRIYQKDEIGMLRFEVKPKIDFNFEVLSELLSGASNSVETYNKVNKIDKISKELVKSQIQIIKLLKELLNKQDNNPQNY